MRGRGGGGGGREKEIGREGSMNTVYIMLL